MVVVTTLLALILVVQVIRYVRQDDASAQELAIEAFDSNLNVGATSAEPQPLAGSDGMVAADDASLAPAAQDREAEQLAQIEYPKVHIASYTPTPTTMAPASIMASPTVRPTDVPLPTATPLPTAAPKQPDAIAVASTSGDTATQSSADGNTTQPVVQADDTIRLPQNAPMVQAVGDAGLFAGPDRSFGHTGYFIPTETNVYAVGRNSNGYWLHVVDPYGRQGWVATRLFETVRGDLGALELSLYRGEDRFAFELLSTPTPAP